MTRSIVFVFSASSVVQHAKSASATKIERDFRHRAPIGLPVAFASLAIALPHTISKSTDRQTRISKSPKIPRNDSRSHIIRHQVFYQILL